MKISVVGCGYLGAVHAACMAELGHDVLGIDIDETKVAALSAGRTPFYEPGFEELLTRVLDTGRLRFTTTPGDDLADVDLHFIAVGTPQSGTGAADLSYVDAAITTLLAGAAPGAVVVGKSTVPVGTATRLADRLAERDIALVWNPEFLREGFAVADTLHPDRIVYGLPADPARAELGRARLDEAYARLLADGIPQIVADYATAELCEATSGDVTALADALGHDDRIGRRFLGAGVGFGGGCLPKDIRAFVARAQELGVHDAVSFLREVDAINQRRRDRGVDLALRSLGDQLPGARVTVLGAAFKPNSDDIRDSPALDIAHRLYLLGAQVSITDPKALDAAVRRHPDLVAEPDTQKALQDADLVLLLTEWDEYVQLDPARVANLVRRPVIIDGRNALNPARWRASGWTYHGLGR
ncbi:UDP-glucose dehydrogenase family protein [Arachnia propionica]|uniref:UDP-glucose dehydrogenase family protein n=1 Tax=Arachnia propionica TaxID=1750 RepID=UPI003C6EF76C